MQHIFGRFYQHFGKNDVQRQINASHAFAAIMIVVAGFVYYIFS